MRKLLLIISLLMTHLACAQKPENKEESMTKVESASDHTLSLVNLIATPEKYHGKKVQIIGYLNIEFEGNGIYLHKDDCEQAIYVNGMWVSLNGQNRRVINDDNLNKKYVLLEGVFNMNKRGHMGLWSGEIEGITRIVKWN